MEHSDLWALWYLNDHPRFSVRADGNWFIFIALAPAKIKPTLRT